MSEESIHKFADEVIDLALTLNQKEIINLAVDHGLIVPRGIACKEGRPCNCMFMCDKERGYERVYVPPRVVNETYAPSFGQQHGRILRPEAPKAPEPRRQKSGNELLLLIGLATLSIILALVLPGPGGF